MEIRLSVRRLTQLLALAKNFCKNKIILAKLETVGDQIFHRSLEEEKEKQQFEIQRLREELFHDKELTLIFDLIWYALRPAVNRDSYELSREGFIKFSTIFRYAVGIDSEEVAMTDSAHAEYESAIDYFGPLTKDIFCDVLCELVGNITIFVVLFLISNNQMLLLSYFFF